MRKAEMARKCLALLCLSLSIIWIVYGYIPIMGKSLSELTLGILFESVFGFAGLAVSGFWVAIELLCAGE